MLIKADPNQTNPTPDETAKASSEGAPVGGVDAAASAREAASTQQETGQAPQGTLVPAPEPQGGVAATEPVATVDEPEVKAEVAAPEPAAASEPAVTVGGEDSVAAGKADEDDARAASVVDRSASLAGAMSAPVVPAAAAAQGEVQGKEGGDGALPQIAVTGGPAPALSCGLLCGA